MSTGDLIQQLKVNNRGLCKLVVRLKLAVRLLVVCRTVEGKRQAGIK